MAGIPIFWIYFKVHQHSARFLDWWRGSNRQVKIESESFQSPDKIYIACIPTSLLRSAMLFSFHSCEMRTNSEFLCVEKSVKQVEQDEKGEQLSFIYEIREWEVNEQLNKFLFVRFLAGSSMRRHPQHAHFTGTIQVMKAVGSHLVLTFCERNELFTIILFREKNVKAQDVSVWWKPKIVDIQTLIDSYFNVFSQSLPGYRFCARTFRQTRISCSFCTRIVSFQHIKSNQTWLNFLHSSSWIIEFIIHESVKCEVFWVVEQKIVRRKMKKQSSKFKSDKEIKNYNWFYSEIRSFQCFFK